MSQVPTPSEELDAIYSALGHAKRRGIMATLAFRPATVSQLADEHGMSLPAIHKHIRTLEEARLIRRQKVGRINFVALNRVAIQVAQAWLKEFHTDWGNDQETLENYIASLSKSEPLSN